MALHPQLIPSIFVFILLGVFIEAMYRQEDSLVSTIEKSTREFRSNFGLRSDFAKTHATSRYVSFSDIGKQVLSDSEEKEANIVGCAGYKMEYCQVSALANLNAELLTKINALEDQLNIVKRKMRAFSDNDE